MNLSFDLNLAEIYTSACQRARVLTEDWVLKEVYCPSCGGPVHDYCNNRPVADFYCKECIEDFELKSKKGEIWQESCIWGIQSNDREDHLSRETQFLLYGSS